MADHNYSKYLFILSIFIFIATIHCITISPTVNATTKKTINATNLGRLSTEKFQNTFCSSFDTVLADVDVIFNDIGLLTKKHIYALEKLEKAGKKIIFYTKTLDSALYKDVLAEKLKELDYNTEIEIIDAATAMKSHFTKIDLEGKAYVIGDEDFQQFVQSLGVETIYSADSVTYENYNTSFNTPLDSEIKSVIIGFDVNLNLFKVVQAFRYLNESEVQLFMTHPKSIYGEKFHRAWIKYLVEKANRTEQYIDIDGIFGNYLVEKYNLNEKVLVIPSEDRYSMSFVAKNKFQALLFGKKIKITANNLMLQNIYSAESFESLFGCPIQL